MQTDSASSPGLLARNLAGLDSGYFALVMATGIVSIGTDLLGHLTLSQVLFGVAAAAWVVLLAAYTARLVWYPAAVRDSLRDPTTAMAYFTVTAGTDVLALRLAMGGHTSVALGLGSAAALVWLLLTYGLPWAIVADARRPGLADINGTWLVWVVSTQSLAVLAAALAPTAPAAWLAADLPIVAVSLWGVGVMLYLILIGIIFLRLLLIEVTPAQMGPAYWIAMGATAISVRAAGGIAALHTPPSAALVSTLHPFLVGTATVMWAWGTWWIPLLVLFGVWRYVVKRWQPSYEPRLWNVVFPLGMYTVACYSLGQQPGLGFLASIARVWVWVGLAAWVAVVAVGIVAAAQAVIRRHTPAGVQFAPSTTGPPDAVDRPLPENRVGDTPR